MIKQTILDNHSKIQLEVWNTEGNTIRLYLSDSEDPTDMYSSQYIDLDENDTDYLINQLTECKKNFVNEK